MKLIFPILLLVAIVGCSSSPLESPSITPELLDKRYRSLWDSVDGKMEMPALTVHIGASKGNKTALWVMTEDKVYKDSERKWSIDCGEVLAADIEEIIYDPKFRVSQLVVTRSEALSQTISCTIALDGQKSNVTLPELFQSENESFSFLAYSCNEPFTTKDRDGEEGILNRDISLWRRMQARAGGEDSSGQIPTRPNFVLGVGDQIYVDPDPGESEPLSFFGGKRSSDWFIESDKESLYSALRTVYRYNFSVPHVSKAFSKISSKMMWDDHEIRDGWGSQGDEDSEVWRRYFFVARHAFIANQLLRTYRPGDINQEKYDLLVHGNSSLHQIFSEGERTHFLMLDSRSKRRVNANLFDQSSSNAVDEWLSKGNTDAGDLYILTVGTPLFPSRVLEDLSKIESTEIGDDLRDSWGHPDNTAARKELAGRIHDHFSRNKNDRLLVVSGDVHFSSLYYLSIGDRVFGQEVVTSGIAHSLPSAVMKVNFLIDTTIPIKGISVKPAGKINHSATFSEVVVRAGESRTTPDVDLIFHSNGTKVGSWYYKFIGKPDWVIGNTNIANNEEQLPLWYHTYRYNFEHPNEHLSAVPKGVMPAGLIIPLSFNKLPPLKEGKLNNNVYSAIQGQSVFCSIEDLDYNDRLAKSWDLDDLPDCIPLSTP